MSTIKSSAENLTLNADGANNDVIIQSNGSTKVTVDGATGYVGVGTTSPSANLHADIGTNNTGLYLNSTDATTGIVLADNGGSVNIAANNSGDLRFMVGGDANTLSSNASEKVRFLSGGGLTFNGDTAAANALDDYEEGTWTPLHLSAGSTSDATVSHVSGIYTKVGRLVTAIIRLRTTSNGTDTGQVGISLPFTVGDNLGTTGLEGGTAVGYYYGAGLSHSALFASPVEGSAYLSLNYLATSTSTTTSAYNVNHADNIFDCRITINYMT